MAALNQSETEALREAIAAIDNVLRRGYDPNNVQAANRDAHFQMKLADAKTSIHTIVQMKGYYPK